jgi:hypothetical protein
VSVPVIASYKILPVIWELGNVYLKVNVKAMFWKILAYPWFVMRKNVSYAVDVLGYAVKSRASLIWVSRAGGLILS